MHSLQHTRQAREIFNKVRSGINTFLSSYSPEMLNQVFNDPLSYLWKGHNKEVFNKRMLAVADEVNKKLQCKISTLNELLLSAMIESTYRYYEIQEATDVFDILLRFKAK